MASGVNYLAIQAATPATRLKPGEYDGRVKVMTDIVELLNEPAGIVPMCGKLPKGAIVLAVLLSTGGVGNDIDIGDRGLAARYFTAHASAINFLDAGNVLAGINYEVLEANAAALDSEIIVTLSGASTGTIKLTVLYAHD